LYDSGAERIVSWDKIVARHLVLAGRIYDAQQIAQLGKLSGLALQPDGRNSAKHAGDVKRYLEAVRQVCGEIAFASAKLQCTVAAKEHGLTFNVS
jgi:hypothetical protein